MPGDLIGNARQHTKQIVVFDENLANGSRSVHAKWMKLPERQQTGHLIHFGSRQNDGADRRVPFPMLRPELWRRLNLSAEIRRRVQQCPLTRNSAERNLSLRPRSACKLAGAQPAAVRAEAVPLRKTAAGPATEDSDLHAREDRRR